MTETLVKVKPTDPLRLVKYAECRKRKWSDSSGTSSMFCFFVKEPIRYTLILDIEVFVEGA
jgi:hypothetical protein